MCAQRPTPARETPNSSLVHHNAEGRRTQRRVPQLDNLTGRPLACTRRAGRRASSMPAHQALRPAGELRIRLDTTYLELPRPTLGSVRRSYEGINALALLVSERHPDAGR